MELKEIEIQAFRSLIDQKISVDERCLAFIGLNESGKSNILEAIRKLDSNVKFSLRDRSKINNQLPSIVFKFKLTDEEKIKVKEYIKKYYLGLQILTYQK
ncbi:MAG: AAA family ATPase [Ignavibacteriaceae bacterium]|nr:AAA family ATPase [Ignavibacteriaceae bacterium]